MKRTGCLQSSGHRNCSKCQKNKLRDFRKALSPTVAARLRRPVQSDDNIENGRMIATIQASKPGNDYYSIWVPMRTARGHLQSSARWICSMFCSGNPHFWFSRISQPMNNFCLVSFKYQMVQAKKFK